MCITWSVYQTCWWASDEILHPTEIHVERTVYHPSLVHENNTIQVTCKEQQNRVMLAAFREVSVNSDALTSCHGNSYGAVSMMQSMSQYPTPPRRLLNAAIANFCWSLLYPFCDNPNAASNLSSKSVLLFVISSVSLSLWSKRVTIWMYFEPYLVKVLSASSTIFFFFVLVADAWALCDTNTMSSCCWIKMNIQQCGVELLQKEVAISSETHIHCYLLPRCWTELAQMEMESLWCELEIYHLPFCSFQVPLWSVVPIYTDSVHIQFKSPLLSSNTSCVNIPVWDLIAWCLWLSIFH